MKEVTDVFRYTRCFFPLLYSYFVPTHVFFNEYAYKKTKKHTAPTRYSENINGT